MYYVLTDNRATLYQWDTGASIQLQQLTADALQFCTPQGLIVREVANNTVAVPDAFLQSWGNLTAYAVKASQDGNVTQTKMTFTVQPRPKPVDYIDPPDEPDNIAQLIARITPTITAYDGSLEANTIYTQTIATNATYRVPTVSDATKDNTIILYAHVTAAVTITWGDVLFVDGITPTIGLGYYEFVFTYHPIAQKWVVGAMEVASSD